MQIENIQGFAFFGQHSARHKNTEISVPGGAPEGREDYQAEEDLVSSTHSLLDVDR